MTDRFYVAYDERASPENTNAVQDRAIVLSAVGMFPGDYLAIKQAKQDCINYDGFVLVSYEDESENALLRNPILVLHYTKKEK